MPAYPAYHPNSLNAWTKLADKIYEVTKKFYAYESAAEEGFPTTIWFGKSPSSIRFFTVDPGYKLDWIKIEE